MTNEQYERLKQYEQHLIRGYKGNYSFGVTKADFEGMKELYFELGGNGTIQSTCSSCILKMTKYLGKAYFTYTPTKKPTSKTRKTSRKGAK